MQTGKFHGQRSPLGHKELDMTEYTHTHTPAIITLVCKNVSRNTGSENPTFQILGEEGRSSEWVLLTYKAV